MILNETAARTLAQQQATACDCLVYIYRYENVYLLKTFNELEGFVGSEQWGISTYIDTYAPYN